MLHSSSQLPTPGRLFLPGCAIAAGLLAVSSPVFAAPTPDSRSKLVASALEAPMTLRVGKSATYPLQPRTTFTLLKGAENVFCEVKNGTLTVKGMGAGLVKMRLNTPGQEPKVLNLQFVEPTLVTNVVRAQVVERAPAEGTTPTRLDSTTNASPTSEMAPNSNLGLATTGGPVKAPNTTTSPLPLAAPMAPSPLSTDLTGDVSIPAPPAPSLPALAAPAYQPPVNPVPTLAPVAAAPASQAPQISPSLPAPSTRPRPNVSYKPTASLAGVAARAGAGTSNGRQSIQVTQGLARLLSFPTNILAVFFSDPNVMDARAINARTIAVTGVGAGPSTLAVFTSRFPGDAIGRANIYRIQTIGKMGSSPITSSPDPRMVETAINSALNDPRIRASVITLPDGSIAARLSGTVRNEAEVQAAVTTAAFYVPKVVSSLYTDPTALTLDAAQSSPPVSLQDNLRSITGNNSIEILPLPSGVAFKAEVNSPEEAESLMRILPTLNQQVTPFIVIRGQDNVPTYFNASIPTLSVEDRQMTQKLQDATGIRSVYIQRASGNSLAFCGTVKTRTELDTVRRYAIIVGQVQQGGGGAGSPSIPAYDAPAGYSRNLGIQMFVRITDPGQSVIRKVTVETSVVEIARTALNNLGATYGSVSVTDQTNSGGVVTRRIDPTLNQGTILAGSGFLGGESLGNIDPYRVRLNALVSKGDARILSQPNVSSVEGAAAQITIGGERPVPKAVATNGAVGTQIEFRRYGVIISMRPTITGDNNIMLQIRADITQPDRTFEINLNGALIPGETVRSVDTTINVRPGDTVVMGGLISNEKRQATSKVPFLGDFPIIGKLFQSKRFDNNETELAIFMTPRIEATPVDAETLETFYRVGATPPLPSREESNGILFQDTARSN